MYVKGNSGQNMYALYTLYTKTHGVANLVYKPYLKFPDIPAPKTEINLVYILSI